MGKQNMILKSEMAYELGGGTLPAVGGTFFTESKELVPEDEILLLGPDLPEITSDVAFARITLIRLKEKSIVKEEQAYDILRRIEYGRYHVSPYGYMMRVSAIKEREPVRVGKKALTEGLDFGQVGNLFLQEYHRQKEVAAVKLIFVTQPDFPYEALRKQSETAEQITESLDYIFHNLQMNCNTCGLKPVCDEVEGLRELHFGQEGGDEAKEQHNARIL